MALLDTRGITHAEIVTFPHNPKHLGLYQKFGFWPRFLTAIMSKTLKQASSVSGVTLYSQVPETERTAVLQACREVTDAVYEGLDLRKEIESVDTQGLGDTVLLREHEGLAGFGVCRCGPGTEAGGGSCLVKFGAARPGPHAVRVFDGLLDACESHAAERGMSRLVTGVNTARHEAYRTMIGRGYRTEVLNVSMSRPNEPGYNRPDVCVVDDWR
jgi:hypothetical protein